MLTTKLIHPELIALLAHCGHGDQILIADGNYPVETESGDAAKVYLGLCAGQPTVTQVLDAVLSVVRVEKAEVMTPGDGSTPEIFGEFSARLGGMPLQGLSRGGFYEAASHRKVRVAIATGEQRTFANLLLTVGVA